MALTGEGGANEEKLAPLPSVASGLSRNAAGHTASLKGVEGRGNDQIGRRAQRLNGRPEKNQTFKGKRITCKRGELPRLSGGGRPMEKDRVTIDSQDPRQS